MNEIMENLRDKINVVIKELNLANEDFQLVRLTRYKQILLSILDKFTVLKKTQINKWWWNFFRESNYYFYPDNVFNALSSLIDEREPVWFVIDDESKESASYWLYEGKIHAITSVLKELSFTEYYIVSKKLEWIICENHHNLLLGSGHLIVEKMKSLSSKNGKPNAEKRASKSL